MESVESNFYEYPLDPYHLETVIPAKTAVSTRASQGKTGQIMQQVGHCMGVAATANAICYALPWTDYSQERALVSTGLSAIYLASYVASRCLRTRQPREFDAEHLARQLVADPPNLKEITDCQSMLKVFSYLIDFPVETKPTIALQTRGKLHKLYLMQVQSRHSQLEEALYTWIDASKGSPQEIYKILQAFYRYSDRDRINVLDQIAEGNYQQLSNQEIYEALRYAFFYDRTTLLHSIDFGIFDKLVELNVYISNKSQDKTTASIRRYLNALIACVQKLKTRSLEDANDLHQRWKALKATWQCDPIDERNRLSSVYSLGSQKMSYIRACGHIVAHSLMLGHVLEVKALLRDTHYGLIHATRAGNYVYEKFHKVFKEKLDGHHSSMYHHLRFENDPDMQTLMTAEEWSKQTEVNDWNLRDQAQLVSCDGYCFNTRSSTETTWGFVRENKSVHPKASSKALNRYLTRAGLRQEDADQTCQELLALDQQVQKSSQIGNMYLIAIPIRDAKRMFYASHPFGVPYGGWEGNGDHGYRSVPPEKSTPLAQRKILTANQRDEAGGDQYRACAGLLSPDEHHVFFFPGFPDKAGVKVKAKEIAARALARLG